MIDKSIPDGIGFSRVPNDFITDNRFSPTEKLIQVYLLGRPSVWAVHPAQISEALGFHPDTVKRALAKLQEHGYNSVRYRESGGNMVYAGRDVRAISSLTTRTETPMHQSSGGADAPTPPAPVPPPPLHGDPHPPRTDAPTIKKELQERDNKKEVQDSEYPSAPSSPQQSERPLTSEVKPQWDTVPRSVCERLLTSTTKPGTFKTSNGNTSFTDDDIGDLAHARMAKEFERGINLDGPPSSNVKQISGLIRASNVHLYRKAN
jgi:hypothetical protein